MQASARRLFETSIDIHRQLVVDDNYLKNVIRVTEIWIEALKNSKKIIFFGNGGSAADAQHLAGELVGKFKMERDALPALALNTNTSILTAIANDYDFNRAFERQVAALVRPGDVAVGISTSGNSKNVLYGLQKAKEIGAVTIGFLGCGGGIIRDVCDVALIVPSNDTPRIQEAHILTGHVICELVEKALFEVWQ